MLHPATGDADGYARARHVRYRHAELPGALGDSLSGAAEVLHAAEGVEEVVHLLGVVEAFALTGLGPDPVQPDQGIRLRERQVDVHERIPVSEVGRILVAVVQADRYLGVQVVDERARLLEPGPQTSRDDREEDVVDGGADGP